MCLQKKNIKIRSSSIKTNCRLQMRNIFDIQAVRSKNNAPFCGLKKHLRSEKHIINFVRSEHVVLDLDNQFAPRKRMGLCCIQESNATNAEWMLCLNNVVGHNLRGAASKPIARALEDMSKSSNSSQRG